MKQCRYKHFQTAVSVCFWHFLAFPRSFSDTFLFWLSVSQFVFRKNFLERNLTCQRLRVDWPSKTSIVARIETQFLKYVTLSWSILTHIPIKGIMQTSRFYCFAPSCSWADRSPSESFSQWRPTQSLRWQPLFPDLSDIKLQQSTPAMPTLCF